MDQSPRCRRRTTPGRVLSHLIAAIAAAVSLAACSGDGTSTNDAAGSTPVGPLARLTVSPQAVTFTAKGGAQTLTVHGFDVDGHEVPVTSLSFTSSTPDFATVDAGGQVQSAADIGSAVIDVRAGDIVAPPVTVLGIKPAAGVLLVADAQISSGPTLQSATERTVRYTLAGVGNVAVGTLLLGTGEIPLAGQVVALQAAGNGVQVDVQDAPKATLISDMQIDLKFTPDQVNAASGITGDLTQSGSAMARSRPQAARNRAQGRTVGPFECDGDIDFGLVHTDLSAKLNKPNLGFIIHDVLTGSVQSDSQVLVQGTASATASAVFRVDASVSGSITCTAAFARLRAPVFGAASAFIAPTLPVGAKITLGASATYSAFAFGATDTLTATVDLGYDYDRRTGVLNPHTGISFDNDFSPVITLPTDQSPRATLDLFAGLTSGLDFSVGVSGLLSANLELMAVEAGPAFEARATGPYTGATDTGFDSGYELDAKATVAAGSDVVALAKALSIPVSASMLSATWNNTLGTAPALDAAAADEDRFAAGDTVTFGIDLKADSLRFPVLGANVAEVRIYRLDYDAGTATPVVSATAADGQAHFDLPWQADAAGQLTDGQGRPLFYAFVIDKLLDTPLAALGAVVPFELGAVRSQNHLGQRLAGTGTSSMALGDDGRIIVRGTNNGGALGVGDAVGIGAFTEWATVPLTQVTAIAGDAWFGAALTGDGHLYAWGWGPAIGVPSKNSNPAPLLIDDGSGSRNVAVSAGYDHTLVLKADGSVWGFGTNSSNVLGAGGSGSFHDTGMGPAKAIAAGGTVSVVVRPDGTVWTMGRGAEGQLGNGSFADSATPVQVNGLTDVVAVAAGNLFAMALTRDGTVWAWGYNADGELGNGTTTNSATPVKVGSLSGVTKISAGDYHGMALAGDTVYTWGMGQYGRLGTGDQNNRTSPVAVQTFAVDIDGGEFHSLAALRSGIVVGWGLNTLGTIYPQNSPANALVPLDTGLRVGPR